MYYIVYIFLNRKKHLMLKKSSTNLKKKVLTIKKTKIKMF